MNETHRSCIWDGKEVVKSSSWGRKETSTKTQEFIPMEDLLGKSHTAKENSSVFGKNLRFLNSNLLKKRTKLFFVLIRGLRGGVMNNFVSWDSRQKRMFDFFQSNVWIEKMTFLGFKSVRP